MLKVIFNEKMLRYVEINVSNNYIERTLILMNILFLFRFINFTRHYILKDKLFLWNFYKKFKNACASKKKIKKY